MPVWVRDKRGMVLLRYKHPGTRWLPGQVLRVQLHGWLLPLLYVYKGGLRG